eukprot:scaffold6446_cov104-Isochrysis_galbana.AAC.27
MTRPSSGIPERSLEPETLSFLFLLPSPWQHISYTTTWGFEDHMCVTQARGPSTDEAVRVPCNQNGFTHFGCVLSYSGHPEAPNGRLYGQIAPRSKQINVLGRGSTILAVRGSPITPLVTLPPYTT